MAKKNNPQDKQIEEMLHKVLGRYQEILFKAANAKKDEDLYAYKERFIKELKNGSYGFKEQARKVVNNYIPNFEIPTSTLLQSFGARYGGEEIKLTTYVRMVDTLTLSMDQYRIRIDEQIRDRERQGKVTTVMDLQNIINQDLRDDNVTVVRYANGTSVPVDKYAAMLARTTRAETENLSMIQQALSEGIDLVECDIVSPTCDSCAVYQGRVYSISGNDSRYPALYKTAFKSGYSIIHPNCRHSWSPYHVELYSEEERRQALERSNRTWTPDGDGRVFQQTEWARAEYSKGQQLMRQWNAEIVEYERMKAHYREIGQEPPYKSLGAFRREVRKPKEKQSLTMQEWKFLHRQVKLYEKADGKIDKDLTKASSDDIILNEQSRKAIGDDATTLQQAIEKTPKLIRDAFKKNQVSLRILDAHYVTTDKQVAHFSPGEGGIRFDIEQDGKPSDADRAQYQTYFHETGHNLDYVIGKKISGRGYASSEYKSPNHIEEVFYRDKKGNIVGRSIRNLSFDNMIKKEGKAFLEAYRQIIETRTKKKASSKDVYEEICRDFENEPLVNKRQLSDILDGITNGEMQRMGYDLGATHTRRTPDYWKKHTVGSEAFAHFTSVISTNKKMEEKYRAYFPKSFQIFEEILRL